MRRRPRTADAGSGGTDDAERRMNGQPPSRTGDAAPRSRTHRRPVAMRAAAADTRATATIAGRAASAPARRRAPAIAIARCRPATPRVSSPRPRSAERLNEPSPGTARDARRASSASHHARRSVATHGARLRRSHRRPRTARSFDADGLTMAHPHAAVRAPRVRVTNLENQRADVRGRSRATIARPAVAGRIADLSRAARGAHRHDRRGGVEALLEVLPGC